MYRNFIQLRRIAGNFFIHTAIEPNLLLTCQHFPQIFDIGKVGFADLGIKFILSRMMHFVDFSDAVILHSGIDHRCFNTRMSQKLLHKADACAASKNVNGNRVAQAVQTCPLTVEVQAFQVSAEPLAEHRRAYLE